MKRSSLNFLQKWSQSNQRKPLILRGARQVGKSTLVRLFCKEHNLRLIEINFEKTKLRSLDNQEHFTIQAVVDEIEILTKSKLTDDVVLFLDEIQEQPIALNRLRYFYEELPKLKVIAAGSLLEVVIDQVKYPMPVGRVDFYNLGPMTFTEFLEARGESLLVEKLSEISLEIPPQESMHVRLVELLKEYFYTGGMPAVVKEFCETRDLERVRAIQLSILEAYRADIHKYTERKKQASEVLKLFDYVPSHLGEDKVKYSDISDRPAAQVKEAIGLLSKAHVIHKIMNNTCSGIPLNAFATEDSIKLYFLDVGLYNAILGVSYQDLLFLSPDKLMTRGKIAEQFVAQHLAYRHEIPLQNTLYYWLRTAKKGAAEVDFIISENAKILPIEVKSGLSGKMRSLHELMKEKKFKKAIRLDLKTRLHWVTKVKQNYKNENLQYELLCIPLYAVERLVYLIEKF